MGQVPSLLEASVSIINHNTIAPGDAYMRQWIWFLIQFEYIILHVLI